MRARLHLRLDWLVHLLHLNLRLALSKVARAPIATIVALRCGRARAHGRQVQAILAPVKVEEHLALAGVVRTEKQATALRLLFTLLLWSDVARVVIRIRCSEYTMCAQMTFR